VARSKREVFTELIEEVRRSQAATARFDRAVAEAIGVNLTDLSCLDVLSNTGPLTAGQLAKKTGLSSGAMTTAIDRLERAGYARRSRDEQDRRRVVVELTEAAYSIADYYAEHAALGEEIYKHRTAAQMEMLLQFMRAGRALNERRAAELEQEARSEDSG
jgi:DNA-binding MarR family transcriptional regulator